MTRLALIGKNGAGKSAVCAYLVSKGFTAFSLSDIVREEATKQGLPLTRNTLIQTGNKLKKDHAPNYLATESHKKARLCPTPIVFDSIRNTEEALYLRSQGCHLIGIDAPITLRYQRIKERAHSTDHIDFNTFKAQDELENSGKSSGQNINAAFTLCEIVLQNDTDLPHLHTQIDTLLKEITPHATT